jgi:hypothetical protein
MPQLDPLIFSIIVNFITILILFIIICLIPLFINYFDLLHILLNLFLKIINQNFFVFKKYLNFFCSTILFFIKQLQIFNFFFFFHVNSSSIFFINFFKSQKCNLIYKFLKNYLIKPFLLFFSYFFVLIIDFTTLFNINNLSYHLNSEIYNLFIYILKKK